MNIEDTIAEEGLPVNSLAMTNRLQELIRENNTNCLLNCTDDQRIRRLLWLINSQFYGQSATIDMTREWYEITKDLRAAQEAVKTAA